MVWALQLLSYLKVTQKLIQMSSMSMTGSMQQGIYITTEFFSKKNRSFHFVWIVRVDCMSFSFCLLSRPERLEAHGFSFASFGSSLGLAFELNALGAIHGFVSFSVLSVVITIWTNIWTVLPPFGCHKYSQPKRQAQRAAKTRKRKAMSFKAFRARKEVETERHAVHPDNPDKMKRPIFFWKKFGCYIYSLLHGTCHGHAWHLNQFLSYF